MTSAKAIYFAISLILLSSVYSSISIKNIYLENTKLNSSVLDNLLSSDIWLDAETCLAYGLVDKII